MERYIGKMLDNRYEILEIIGKGGMAVVFKAKCHRLNRLVAIKVLKPELADDAEFRRRFHDESQAVAMLSHPNIVSVYDVSKGGDLEYIVMELIDGITLKQYMERRGQLNWRESLHFITQIMKGLSHAHSRGIIHRDIKPHNIMVLRDGSVKVADFGIACLSSKQTMSSKETMGSVHYISPEQAKGEWTDARSDIYSAGVVLYEMLTNRLPFEGDSPVSIAIQHFSAVPLNPREIKSDIPEALEQICMKAMAPQVKQRYASAEEMIHDLEEFRKNPEINFDYDLLDLRSSVTDEPTQPIDARELHNLREKEDDYDDRGGGGVWKKLLMTVAAIALSVALIYGLYQVILNSFAPPPVTEFEVPNLIGMTVEAAEADPRVKDIFTIVVEDTINNDEYPAGQIIHQDPEPERKKSDFVITVLVSKGVQSDKMPSIVGLERTSAEIILKNLRLDLQVVIGEEVFSDEYPAGQVIKSVPAKDEIISKGDTVTLTISKGKDLKPVTVISFLTMTREKAEQEAVQTLGLKVKIVSAPGSEPAGTVIGQNIVAGTSVLQETEIELTVSDGSLAEEPPIEDGDFEGGDVDTPSTDPDGDD